MEIDKWIGSYSDERSIKMNNDSEKEKTCKNCLFSQDYGESTLYIKCEKGRKKYVEKSGTCKDWTPRS